MSLLLLSSSNFSEWFVVTTALASSSALDLCAFTLSYFQRAVCWGRSHRFEYNAWSHCNSTCFFLSFFISFPPPPPPPLLFAISWWFLLLSAVPYTYIFLFFLFPQKSILIGSKRNKWNRINGSAACEVLVHRARRAMYWMEKFQ